MRAALESSSAGRTHCLSYMWLIWSCRFVPSWLGDQSGQIGQFYTLFSSALYRLLFLVRCKLVLFLFESFLSWSRFFFLPFFPAKENKTPPPQQVLSLAFQPLKSATGNTPSKVTREKTPHMPTCSSATTQPVSVETFSGLRLRSAAQHWTLSEIMTLQ